MSKQFNVIYSHSRDLDIYTFHIRGNSSPSYGRGEYETAIKYLPQDFVDNIIAAPNKVVAESRILNYWSKTHDEKYLKALFLKSQEYDEYLNSQTKLIIDTLENIYQKKYIFEPINVFLTTFYKCSYMYPFWFMAYAEGSKEKLIQVATHELNHFMFYKYNRDSLRQQGFSESQIEHLKESLSVLTVTNVQDENKNKIDVLPIQNFVYANRDKSVDNIIELVIQNKLLENIK